VEKISEISTTWIARYELLNLREILLLPFIELGNCTSQAHICMKKCPKLCCSFGFILQGKLTTFLKKIQII